MNNNLIKLSLKKCFVYTVVTTNIIIFSITINFGKMSFIILKNKINIFL